MPVPDDPRFKTAKEVREACRAGTFREPTAGQCSAYVQANLIVLPERYAADFRGLCRRNPVPCPLLGETRKAGDPRIQKSLAEEGDVTTDAPGYNIYEDGKLIHENVPDCRTFWTGDSVGFLIGCSFTFEQGLIDAGLIPRHIELGRNVPMYKTSTPLAPSGVFGGNMVVSMRPYRPEHVQRVREVCRPYILTHGEPIVWASSFKANHGTRLICLKGTHAAEQLGINDINKPDYGDSAEVRDGEVPVFWGCGVTPQLVATSSPEVKGVVIGHGPGRMICLDLLVKDILR